MYVLFMFNVSEPSLSLLLAPYEAAYSIPLIKNPGLRVPPQVCFDTRMGVWQA